MFEFVKTKLCNLVFYFKNYKQKTIFEKELMTIL